MGYITIKLHRYLMQLHLGGKLKEDQIVHHVDGNKQNNDINNLVILSKSQHMSIHQKGKKKSEQHRMKLSEVNKGKKMSLQSSIKKSLANKGKKRSDQTKQKMSNGEKKI